MYPLGVRNKSPCLDLGLFGHLGGFSRGLLAVWSTLPALEGFTEEELHYEGQSPDRWKHH